MKNTARMFKIVAQEIRSVKRCNASFPENLIEDLLRLRSLSRGLDSLGYPDFLIKLFKKNIHSRKVLG